MGYIDIAKNGLLVRGTAVEDGGPAVVRFGDDAPIDVGVYVRNIRVSEDGSMCVFKGQDDKGRSVTRSGVMAKFGTVHGDEAIALSPSNRVVYCDGPKSYVFNGIPAAIPLPDGTSQGIHSVREDGSVVWTDQRLSPLTFGPFKLIKWTSIGPWTFGVTQWGVVAWNAVERQGYAVKQDSSTLWTPRGAMVDGRLVIALSLPEAVIHESAFTPWVEPVVEAPAPEPAPPVVPVPEVPIVSISSSEIVAAVTEAKAEVEALGYVFKTVEEAMRDNYAHYTYADKQQAFLVTMRAAWKLAQKYPDAGIGLELYNGPSGTPSPFPEDGTDRYSGDIILLSKSGPSVDVLIAGVQPAAQVDTTTDPQAPSNWRRDWRAPLNPYRGVTAPVPVPVPPVLPTPDNTPVSCNCDLEPVLARLTAIDAALARLEARKIPELPELPDLEAMGWPTYTGTAQGKWPLGTVSFTLTPKETE